MIKENIWLKLTLAAFFWGLMFHLAKYTVIFVSPESTGAWRFLLAGCILMYLVNVREGINWSGLHQNWIPLLAMAIVGIVGMNLFLFYGLKHTSSVNSALIMALCPSLITVFSLFLTDEKIIWRQIAGLLLCLTGVAIVVSQGSFQMLIALSLGKGDLLVLCAALCWVIYAIIPRRFIHALAPLQITASTLFVGGVIMSIYAYGTQQDFLRLPPIGSIAAIIMMSIFGSVLAYLWWNDGVRQVGAVKSGLFMNIVPISAVLIGIVLGQSITWSQLIGTVLVISGVVFASSISIIDLFFNRRLSSKE